jgi:shikimate dehydrogenase
MHKIFAIFGNPVSHSRSPLMHNTLFTHFGYHACYTRIHLTDGAKLKDTFLRLGLSGANITVPHKEAAFHACDEVRGFAKEVGVVNTIVLENKKLIGYNTDADGFLQALESFGPIQKVLILGAGGTAKAFAKRFLQEKMEVSVLNRSVQRLSYFQSLPLITCSSWGEFTCKEYDLVVNTTSAGLSDDNYPAPKEMIETILSHTKYAADAIYGKQTPFLHLADQRDIPCKDGADMLLYQGVLASRLFCNNRFGIEETAAAMQKSFIL